MSKLEELITELCPNGVPYMEIGKCIRKVPSIDWNLHKNKKFRYVDLSSVDRATHKITQTTEIDYRSAPSRAKQLILEGDVLFGTTRPTLKRYYFVERFLDNQVCSTGFCVLRPNEDIVSQRWLYHILSTEKFSSYVEKFQQGAGYPSISDKDVKAFIIPVPPLPIQEEIVRILDTFSELTAELTAELTVELTARKKQYEYYRALLLPDKTRKHVALGDVCKITRGRVMSKEYLRDNAGQYPVYSSQTANSGIFGFIDTYDYDDESITWTTDGANAGSVFYHANEKFSITNVCGLLRVINKQEISTRYLYFLLQIIAKGYVSSGMGNPKLMSNTLSRIQINIPPLEEQKRIVSILDRFDSLCNDLSNGLPAEIEARKKQYEYYRDKLLTFKELKQ
jgi:type I restriction enzyme S subunit